MYNIAEAKTKTKKRRITKSILFIIKIVFLFASFIFSIILLSPLPISLLFASIKNSITRKIQGNNIR